ncbi:MAG: MarR family winged helix-turn-helix transcriptional regulator [Nocardioidaceae bacterium]
MQPNGGAAPATAEDAVLGTLLALGRTVRARQPGDQVEAALVPVLKVVTRCGSSRLTYLAGRLDLDASTVSRHVKHLEDLGYVERTSDPDDGRASQLAATPSGHQALADFLATRRALVAQALQDWTDTERETLRTLLDRFNCAILDAD